MTDTPELTTPTTPLFSVSTKKLIIYSVLTFGLYELYWFYKNWQAIAILENRKISPFWRSVFCIFYTHSLFRSITAQAKSKGFVETFSTSGMATWYVILTIFGNITAQIEDKIPEVAPYSIIFWLISYATIYPVFQMQKLVNYYNTQINASYEAPGAFSGLSIFICVLGGILTALAIAGMFMPPMPI
jgi:hypothetical protein